jgi:hypothetical protein
MNLDLITILLLAALTALAMNRYNVLPRLYYHYAKVKPFTCLTCLAFWWGAILTFFFTNIPWLLAIPVGLSSAGLTVLIIKLSEK